MIFDVNGLRIEKGDVVAPITGDFKGRVTATKDEDGEGFVCIRAAHRPYSKGVWYASEHVQRLQIAPARREVAPKLVEAPTRIATAEAHSEPTAAIATAVEPKVTRRSTKKRTTVARGARAATPKPRKR